MALNSYLRYKTDIIKKIFGDRDTFNFKYGLEYALNGNLQNPSRGNSNVNLNMDEDPTVFGFDFVILDNSSLFNDVGSFLEFGEQHGYSDLNYRKELYEDFKRQVSKFFNSVDNDSNNFRVGSEYSSFKTHYLNSVNGLNNLIRSIRVGNSTERQFANYGEDKLTFSLSEDIGINAGYLSNLYRNLIYSKKNGRQLLPENLLRFDCVIIISEVRNFVRVSNDISRIATINQNPNLVEEDLIDSFKDNISRYIYTLRDCQFDFNTLSHGDNLNIGGLDAPRPSFSDGINFDIYYKYSGMEMEKFEFSPSVDRIKVKYLNDSTIKPDSYQVNPHEESTLNAAQGGNSFDRYPERLYDLRYRSIKNSDDIRVVELEFPMIARKWQRMDTIRRQRNQTATEDQTGFQRGINRLVSNINRDLQAGFSTKRATLIAQLTGQIRGVLGGAIGGLRNMNAPTNVYYSGNIGNVILDNLKSFGNIGLSAALGTAGNFLNQQFKGVGNSIFDLTNRGVDGLRGVSNDNFPSPFTHDTQEINIPNVYKR